MPTPLAAVRALIHFVVVSVCSWGVAGLATSSVAQELELTLRSRTEIAEGRYGIEHAAETWDPRRTAVIVCDMWDAHHCLNAVRREMEMVGRANQFLHVMRDRGALIIHAPSDCMAPYEQHPARLRAQAAPTADNLPDDISSWCDRIPEEERGVYPIDQSDGGEDDDLEEHARWHEQLASLGLNPRAPWKAQIGAIDIDEQRDAISDQGVEIWNLLEAREIDQVMLVGVHTNMCVLGRPFGLRQMSQNGKRVVLVRDLTDTMYNPQRWPYVSHFAGTDRIVEHIEKFVCPTITSDQVLGGTEFRYQQDERPHLVVLISEDEYETDQTLPAYLDRELASTFRISLLFGRPDDVHSLMGWREIKSADVLLVSMRRRALPDEQLEAIKQAVHRGVPVVGIRTASHAFALRTGEPEAGRSLWPEFDAEVLGGNYHDHYGNKDAEDPRTYVRVEPSATAHPLVADFPTDEWVASSWLYKTNPLAPGTTVVLTGRVGEFPAEPVAWTHCNRYGARVFYTSLGHVDDFANPHFRRLLKRGLLWAAQLERDQEQPLPAGVENRLPR